MPPRPSKKIKTKEDAKDADDTTESLEDVTISMEKAAEDLSSFIRRHGKKPRTRAMRDALAELENNYKKCSETVRSFQKDKEQDTDTDTSLAPVDPPEPSVTQILTAPTTDTNAHDHKAAQEEVPKSLFHGSATIAPPNAGNASQLTLPGVYHFPDNSRIDNDINMNSYHYNHGLQPPHNSAQHNGPLYFPDIPPYNNGMDIDPSEDRTAYIGRRLPLASSWRSDAPFPDHDGIFRPNPYDAPQRPFFHNPGDGNSDWSMPPMWGFMPNGDPPLDDKMVYNNRGIADNNGNLTDSTSHRQMNHDMPPPLPHPEVVQNGSPSAQRPSTTSPPAAPAFKVAPTSPIDPIAPTAPSLPDALAKPTAATSEITEKARSPAPVSRKSPNPPSSPGQPASGNLPNASGSGEMRETKPVILNPLVKLQDKLKYLESRASKRHKRLKDDPENPVYQTAVSEIEEQLTLTKQNILKLQGKTPKGPTDKQEKPSKRTRKESHASNRSNESDSSDTIPSDEIMSAGEHKYPASLKLHYVGNKWSEEKQEEFRARGAIAIEEFCEDHDTEIDSDIRRTIRQVDHFLPQAAQISYELALHVHANAFGNLQCRYHEKTKYYDRWDGKIGDPFIINGASYHYKLNPQASDKFQPRPGFMHCGCPIDEVLMDFYFFKTWTARSRRPSYRDRMEGWGPDCPTPRHRTFVVQAFQAATGLSIDNIYNAQWGTPEHKVQLLNAQLDHLLESFQRLRVVPRALLLLGQTVADHEKDTSAP